jgi:probable phosphoglycerate mutase
MPERNSTRLFLVRHGATQLSTEDRFAGSTDVELSEEGIFQAERLAARLADDSISAVYSSPLKRTLHTARILGGPHGLTPIIRDGLREIDHGHWEGNQAEGNLASQRNTPPGKKTLSPSPPRAAKTA